MMCLYYASNHPMVEELWRGLTHTGVAARILVCSSFMGSTSSQPESQPPAVSQPQKPREPIRLCGTLPTTVVPAERYVEQLWAALDQTLLHSKCGVLPGVGSDTPVGQGGSLNMDQLYHCRCPSTDQTKGNSNPTRSSTTTGISSRDEG